MKTLLRYPSYPAARVAALGLAAGLALGPAAYAQTTPPAPTTAPAGPAVAGRVVDEKGEPLPGVNVVVKNTSLGTATNADGRYTLAAPAGATLVFSFVGYEAQEVPLNGRGSVDVRFTSPAAQSLNEVVVVGYGTQSKREVTGAIASVKGAELASQASQNPVSSLQGKVAGVQITNSGLPGAAPQIRVRGTGSLGGVAPLYVVDGTFLPAGADLSFLNQDDIASLEVLKDAASASIYGIQGANGVVLVTTKRGQSGAVRLTYNGFGGVQVLTNRVQLADARQYAEIFNERNAAAGNPASTNLPLDLPSTDWLREITRTAAVHNHQLSLSGGSERASYSFSGSYLHQDGILQGNDFERITARLQTDFAVTSRIKVGYSASFANLDSHDAPGLPSAAFPSYSPVNLAGDGTVPSFALGGSNVFAQAYVAPPVLQPFLPSGRYGDPSLVGAGLGSFGNPRATLDYFVQRAQGQTLVSNAFASINFLQYLTLRSNVGISYGSAKFYNYQKADSLTTVQVYRGNVLTKGTAQNSQVQWENTLTFDRSFGTDHHLTALAGSTALRYRTEQIIGSISGVQASGSDDYYFGLGTVGTAALRNPADLYTIFSLFARVNYAYKERYLLTASLRRDGSSKYSGGDRYGTFPSVGLGWVVSDESFLKDNRILNFLKLRGSYGLLGNVQVPNNVAVSTVDRYPTYSGFFGNPSVPVTGANVSTQAAGTIRWEKARELDAGLEMRFFANRLSAEVDFYNRRTIDAVFPVPVLSSPGYGNSVGFLANNATFENKGVEAAVRWASAGTGAFTYSVGLTGAYNQNQVLATANGSPLFSGPLPLGGYRTTISQVGSPIGAFYGYRATGIFQTAQEVADSPQAATAAPGDLRYQDQNGDGVLDARDFVVLGNPNPRFTYGLNTNFRYKALDLQVDIQGVGGVEIFNALRLVRFGNENYTADYYRNRFTGPGTSNTTPANLAGRNLDPSSYYVEKGDYIRLRNVQVGFTFPKSLTSSLRLQTLRLYANAQNPLTLTKYKGFSPEVSGTPTFAGVDVNVYPLAATYNLGLNIGF